MNPVRFHCENKKQVTLNQYLCEGLTMRGIDAQVDGNRGDALVGPSGSISLRLNLLPDLIKVCELFALTVEKLCVL